MRRISIRTLMGLILAVAVAFAALRGANAYWAGAIHTLTLCLLGYALLASIRGSRAWLGFLVACGGYFLAIRTLPSAEVDLLPTSRSLKYIQDRVTGEFTITTTTFKPSVSPKRSGIVSTGSIDVEDDRILLMSGPVRPPSIDWGSLLPGAADPRNFRVVAHDFFALAFGGIGALVSRRMWRAD